MQYQTLHTELRARLASLSAQIAASCAQGLLDLPKHAEQLTVGLLRELLDYRSIRNLNAVERQNFPGIDLADDQKKVGFQITATPTLEKVKETLATVLRHGLHGRYPTVKVVVLSGKQRSYSQAAIDAVLQGNMRFSAVEDILDFEDILRVAATASPIALRRALDVLDAYEHGALDALEAADFDPPAVTEEVELNLVELYFPSTLYIADLLERPKQKRDARKHLRLAADSKGFRIPSDYEIFEGKLLTFHNLEMMPNAFEGLFDRGTLTAIGSKTFARTDENQERVFKSLLRFCLQQNLYQQRVVWNHDDKIFVFMPLTDGKLIREEQWTDKRTGTRTVVLYKASKKDPSKGGYRHLAFQVDFLTSEDRWFMAIRPDWSFTTNPNFRPSPIADELLKGIKRLEINKSVEQHFRFLWKWLRGVTDGDLLTHGKGFLSFGELLTFDSHPALDDNRWLPAKMEEPVPPAADEFSDLLTQ